mmetsp:Transcript_37097/g.119633  ORF Transcript_37097/g.119633 Transcript_37097/m.119633 type:complete len:218 (-) Transcript_37097:1349-2002(-)
MRCRVCRRLAPTRLCAPTAVEAPSAASRTAFSCVRRRRGSRAASWRTSCRTPTIRAPTSRAARTVAYRWMTRLAATSLLPISPAPSCARHIGRSAVRAVQRGTRRGASNGTRRGRSALAIPRMSTTQPMCATLCKSAHPEAQTPTSRETAATMNRKRLGAQGRRRRPTQSECRRPCSFFMRVGRLSSTYRPRHIRQLSPLPAAWLIQSRNTRAAKRG